VPYSFYVDIVDKKAPSIWLGSSYTVTKGYSGKLEDKIVCADDYDDNPECLIIGEYDTNTLGSYNLVFEAKDFSGNVTKKDFTLKVVNPGSKTNNYSPSIPFRSLYNEYKKDNTKIGIDVSRWQGTIDYEKVKNEGVEFVFIKLGGQHGIGKEYYLDPKFKENIEGFKSVDIPVGLYFYSYANSIEAAKKDALWVLEQIKDYDIDLPIAFDWESWSIYNDFHMSFNTLTKACKAFIETIESKGYQSVLYSSKNYLINAWQKKDFDVWLAHYTEKTDYDGKYVCWQRTNLAKINGITENTVDFDICYIEE
jgi:GH25 family lysozyme M1 (1,4-beta-N-acetylmuramidase)